mgnify:CR=1 FL=1
MASPKLQRTPLSRNPFCRHPWLCVSHSELLNRVVYDPDTGYFYSRYNGPRKGTRIGMVDNGGYISLTVKRVLYKAHRLAWFYVYGTWPDIIDHINRDKQDNRINNLRSVTLAENSKNWRNIPLPPPINRYSNASPR